MARLLTCGWETGHPSSGEDPNLSSSGAPTVVTTAPRSGKYHLLVNAATEYVQLLSTGALGRAWFTRVCFSFSANPTAAPIILQVLNGSGTGGSQVRLNTNGTLTLIGGGGGSIFTSSTLTPGQYYRLALEVLVAAVPTTSNGTIVLRIDDVEVYNNSGAGNVGTSALGIVVVGNANTSAPGCDLYFDDVAVNDSTGAAQTSWPGEGKIVLLKPTSDGSNTGWGIGAGTNAATTTNLFNAVDNTPPAGVAIASSTTSTQIKSKANNTTNNYTATLGAYTTAVASGGGGLGATDTVTLTQTLADVGQDSTTATSFGITTTNPTVAEFTGSGPAAAAGTAPTNWNRLRSAVQYAPTATLATQPTVKIRKNTGSTSITQMSDFMGLLVEYVPAPATSLPALPRSRQRVHLINR